MRFWPGWGDWLKAAIDQNTYGRVLSATFRRVAEPPAWGQQNFFDGEKSGGGLFDLHIHDTDLVQFFFGRPKSVFSSGYTRFSKAIDHVLTHYEVASGAVVHAEGSWAMTPGFGFNMSYTVNFENATADFDLARGADALRVIVMGQPPAIISCAGADGYVGELRHFIECVENGKQPSVVTVRDALSAVEICEAEEKSVLTRRAVTL
jgi:predicted dehydrogenase